MNKKQVLTLMGIIFLFSVSLLPLSVAQGEMNYVVSSYPFVSYTQAFAFTGEFPDPSTYTTGRCAYYQTFQASNTYYLTGASIWLHNTNGSGTTAGIKAAVYSTNGSYVSKPVSLLATSESEIFTWYDGILQFNLVFNGTYQLQNGVYYALVFYLSDNVAGVADSLTGVCIELDTSAATGQGRYGNYNSGAWGEPGNSAYDLHYIVWGDTTMGTTPTPTPTPSPTPEAMPNWISDIIDAIIPIFTPLLVIFICGALGWRFAGAWGFFAGINLAIVLLYVIAPSYMPLWAIIAVVIIDIGLLFGKVGFDRR